MNDMRKIEQEPKSSVNDDGAAMEAMLHAEGRGDYAVLQSFMSRLDARLRRSADAEIRAAYLDLADRAAKAFEHEAKHGHRTLMKWDHPINVKWVGWGLLKLTESDRRAFEACNGLIR